MNSTLDELRQHELVILRRLRTSPLTEFELASEVAEHSGYSTEQAVDMMADWLDALRLDGFIWAGTLSNAADQRIMAAALTTRGRELVTHQRKLAKDAAS